MILLLNVHFICYLLLWPQHPHKASILLPFFNGKTETQQNEWLIFGHSTVFGPLAFSPVFCLSQSHRISLRALLEVIWKLHSQAIRKWFTRGVSSPLSFFNVTWHQKPHYGKHGMWIWLVCWQHPATCQKITQADPSDKEHLMVADRALVEVPFSPRYGGKSGQWSSQILRDGHRIKSILHECWDLRRCTTCLSVMHRPRSLFLHVQGPSPPAVMLTLGGCNFSRRE